MAGVVLPPQNRTIRRIQSIDQPVYAPMIVAPQPVNAFIWIVARVNTIFIYDDAAENIGNPAVERLRRIEVFRIGRNSAPLVPCGNKVDL